MIGSLPRYAQAPLDYRYALDAAMSLMAGCSSVAVACHIPDLSAEIAQRMPEATKQVDAGAGLWVEPMVANWQNDIADLTSRLQAGSLLVVVASQPLARIIPERRNWPGPPSGLQSGGARKLSQALVQHGFHIEQRYGVHSLRAIILNQVGQTLARLGRPDLGDQLEFAARLHYRAAPPWTALATVGLWIARRHP